MNVTVLKETSVTLMQLVSTLKDRIPADVVMDIQEMDKIAQVISTIL